MTVPRLNYRICDRSAHRTGGVDNEIMYTTFTLPDTAAANQAVALALGNLQTQVDQQVEVFNFGGATVLATLNRLEVLQLPGERPVITLELEHTSDWSMEPIL